MPCYHPIKAYRGREANPETGRSPLVFNHRDGWIDQPVIIPCGQCIGCRQNHARQWAIRCLHESQFHSHNSFITLTIDDKHLNNQNTLVKADFQKFMKRLRKHFLDEKIRYFHCGEYGSETERPHHHACLFGIGFADRKLWKEKHGVKLYRSPTLETIWTMGHSTIGDVTYESACYVAQYVVKKITGPSAADHYQGRQPPYITMSRRPGIGQKWIESYHTDVWPEDRITLKGGIKLPPPRYYDNLYEQIQNKKFNLIKGKREQQAKANGMDPENRPERLEVRKTCALAKSNLKRRDVK